jgi:hypothetical protein
MMCLKQISSHFTTTSHEEDFGDGDKESSPSLARFLVLAKALIVVSLLPFFSENDFKHFYREKLPLETPFE